MAKELIQPNKIYFRNLDSIRFFAALMVFLGHGMSESYKYLNIKDSFIEKFLYAISNGGIGVSIFFVLSGFLITYLILSEIELTDKFSLKNFYVRRILRIWPLYFVVVIIAFLIFPALSILLKSPINQGANIWYQLTFLSNFDVLNIEKNRPGTELLMQNITWSVAIEEQFYAFWPLIFAFLPRKFILPTIITSIIGSLIFRYCHSNDTLTLYFHTLSVVVDLGIGALFAYLIITYSKIRTFFQQTNTWIIFASFILFFYSIMYGDRLFSTSNFFLFRLYLAILFAFIIASQSMIIKPSKIELGNIRFASKWGKYTYGIYLLHPIALEIIHIVEKQLHLQLDSFLSLFISGVCGFILTLTISWVSYEYFEKKFLLLKKSFTSL
jgi:peptidoglycan/LPS O-acetylase OafA/YrhL